MALPQYGKTPRYGPKKAPGYGALPSYGTPKYGSQGSQYGGAPVTAEARRIKRAGSARVALSNLRRGIKAAQGGKKNWAAGNTDRSQALLKLLRKRVKNNKPPTYG